VSHSPEHSAITLTPEMEAYLNTLVSTEEISAYLADIAVNQGLVTRDIYSPDVLIPTALASATPKKVGKVVRLNGVAHPLIADDEAGLLAQETQLYRQALTRPNAPAEPTELPRNERGQFVSAEDAAAKAELELKFKRGDVSAGEYIARSGVVADYLEAQGVPLSALQEAVEEKQTARDGQSWADATSAFVARHGDWPGGEQNKITIANYLVEHNLVDAEDKNAALEAAYAHAVENNLLSENPAVAYQREVSECMNAEDMRRVNHKYFGTALFDR
jgi:hypothetical protein